MREPTLFEKIWQWLTYELPQHFCKHEFEGDFSDVVDWEQCSGAMDCRKCGGLFHYSFKFGASVVSHNDA